MKRILNSRATQIVALIFSIVILAGTVRNYYGATNFDRLVLGTGNFETDPNPTKDLTFQNDEFISNDVNGRLDFGAANILTTGTVGGGAGTLTGLTTLDSAKVTGILNQGNATSDGTASSYFKALGSRLYQAVFRSTTNVLRLGIDTSGAIKASGWLSDTSAFSAALLQVGIYIPGATSTDKYVATPRTLDVTLPVAGDLLACFAKTDSLVVLRAAGTTSGLKFSYIRMR